jgi:DMSO/TMAO reductase YedYZ heme-binding membrane subunit
MREKMSAKADSSILIRVIIAVVIILGSAGFYSLIWHIWQGDVLSDVERFMGVITIIVIVVTFAYVLRQRLQMRKSETFRREKW